MKVLKYMLQIELVFLTYFMHQRRPGQIRIIATLHQLETFSEDFFIKLKQEKTKKWSFTGNGNIKRRA